MFLLSFSLNNILIFSFVTLVDMTFSNAEVPPPLESLLFELL